MPKMMQSVGRIFVQYFNTKYRRTGTRWEGRYKATAVHDDGYLFACMRYIELNPVRAGIVNDPSKYRWSSFRANALGSTDELVVPHPLFRNLGASRSERIEAYRELFGSPLPESDLNAIRDATQHAWALGDEHFRRRITEFNRRAARLPTGRRRPPAGATPIERT
jgi:putative transposase